MIGEKKHEVSKRNESLFDPILEINGDQEDSNSENQMLQLLNEIQNTSDLRVPSRFNSEIIEPRRHNSVSNLGTVKTKNKFRRKKQKKSKKRFNEKKLSELIGQNSDFTEIGSVALRELITNNVTNKLHEQDVEDDSEEEVIYQNNINKIEQKINVSNMNCSCRVF